MNNIFFVLFIIFLILKLCHVIAWSWFLICLPLAVPLGLWAIMVAILVTFYLAAAIGGIIKFVMD